METAIATKPWLAYVPNRLGWGLIAAVVCAVCIGIVKILSEPKTDDYRTSRLWAQAMKSSGRTQAELLTAKKALERQIEILRCPTGGPDLYNQPPINGKMIVELEAELAEVNSRLSIKRARYF